MTDADTTGESVASDVLTHHPLIDGHNDLPWRARRLTGYDFDRLDIAGDLSPGNPSGLSTHTDLPRLRRGRVGAQFWSVFVPSTLSPTEALLQTVEQVDAVYQMLQRWPDDLELARTADDVERIFASGKIASLMGAEGGHSIAGSLGALRMLHRLGVRYLTLTHNDNTPWADSATDVPEHGGLTDFGREVVAEMNRIGMMVDLSHVSADTMRDALEVSTAPVIFSHSSARAVCTTPRNVPDDVLATVANTGGVCMVTFVPAFVNEECWQWRRAAAEAAEAAGVVSTDLMAFQEFLDIRQQRHPRPEATLADVVAHLDHIREVAGVDHLGVGGDYDGVDVLPRGLPDVSGYPALFAALAARGWSRDDLAKVAGGNVLRVMRAVEEVATA